MKIRLMFLTMSSMFLFSAVALQAQKWDEKQKEVWSVVESYNAAWETGDVDAFMSYFHDDYVGWHYDSPVPVGKSTTKKYVELGMKNSKSIFFNMVPLSIQVYDDMAVVHYLFHSIRDEKGEIKNEGGRWTEILKKEKGKWLLVSDHGGEKSH